MTETRIIVLCVITVLLSGPGRALLVRARWTDRIPRSAIALWQSLGGALAICFVGICVEANRAAHTTSIPRQTVTDFNAHTIAPRTIGAMSPGDLFMLTAALIIGTLATGALFTRLIGQARARARQRLLIDLVSSERPHLPGTLVIPSPEVAAFSLPGVRPRVVVSSAAIELLDDDELGAVLAHERAHVRARHDLVLLPFRSLASLLPRSRALIRMRDEVSALVEMAADDRAQKEINAVALARALCHLASVRAPSTVLTTASTTPRRVDRVLNAPRSARACV